MTDNIKELLNKDFSYPEISKQDFQNKIYEKREFYYHKIPKVDKIVDYNDLKKYRDSICNPTNFNLQSHQSLISNFINPQTPYRGLLIFHGLGSGKTIAAVSICENFKEQIQKYNTKIYILVPGPLNKTQWKDDIIKCTKDTYLKDITNTIGYIDKTEQNKRLKIAKNLIMEYYKITTYRGFYNKVLGQKIIEHSKNGKTYRKNEKGEIERDIAIDKIDDLDNSILVIDEAHHLTGNDYGVAVQKIIKNSKNLRVLLLTGTPMKNLADDVIKLINLLRPQNDLINRDLVFTTEKNYLMEFKKGGKEYFQDMTRGYISYYRGANLYTYAKQIDKGEIPEGLLFTPLIRCEMSNFQENVYKDILIISDDSLDRKSAAYANFIFPSYSIEKKEIIGISGRTGMNMIKNILNSNKEKYLNKLSTEFEFKTIQDLNVNEIIKYDDKHKTIQGLIFAKPHLKYFSSKFDKCLTNLMNLVQDNETIENNIKNNIISEKIGTAFIYSNLVKMGIELFEQVLINAGCLEFKQDGKYILKDDTRDYLSGITYKEFKEKKINRTFHPITFFTITGAVDEFQEQIPEEKRMILDTIFNNINNTQGRYIKFILGSKVMTEGITLKNIKEIHVLDTAYHLGQLQQVIGRGIRFCVHNNISTKNNPYPEVSVYRYVVTYNKNKELTNEEILYQKAEKKYILVKETERLMKENAIDCALNYNANIIEEEVEKYNKCIKPQEYNEMSPKSREKHIQCPLNCDFQDCTYKCNDNELNLKYYDKNSKLYKNIIKDKLDYSTFTNILARTEINYCKNKIKEMYKYRLVYILDDILEYVINNFKGSNKELFEPFFVYQALNELLPITENDFNNYNDNIYDKFNIPGYLIYRDKYYIFQPFNQNENVPMYYRNTLQETLINQISFYQYISNTPEFQDFFQNLSKEDMPNEKKKIKYNYNYNLEYYNNKEDYEYVGIIDKPITRKKYLLNELDDIFKIREKREKILKKKRGTGIPTIKGSVCFSSKDKDYLINIAKKIGIEKLNTKTRTNICNAIKYRLLFLEKYSKKENNNKFTYMIIPQNHDKYPFPFNLEDRIDFIISNLQHKVPLLLNIQITELKNGIFENVRDQTLSRYKLEFLNNKDWDIYNNIFIESGFILDNKLWILIIE
jgi:superfamily II DNA or RNA helicase